MKFTEEEQLKIRTPEMNDSEWADRFVTGYRQSFDKSLLEDADVAIERIFAKYSRAEAI